MGVISQNGIDYPVPSVPVQSDGSATDLIDNAVQTGQTLKSYLNSNLPKIRRFSAFVSLSSSTSITGLSNGFFGILYGKFTTNNKWYSMAVDIASIEIAHQFYVSSSAYCNFNGSLTNNTISVTENVGFTSLVFVLFSFY